MTEKNLEEFAPIEKLENSQKAKDIKDLPVMSLQLSEKDKDKLELQKCIMHGKKFSKRYGYNEKIHFLIEKVSLVEIDKIRLVSEYKYLNELKFVNVDILERESQKQAIKEEIFQELLSLYSLKEGNLFGKIYERDEELHQYLKNIEEFPTFCTKLEDVKSFLHNHIIFSLYQKTFYEFSRYFEQLMQEILSENFYQRDAATGST